MPVSALPNPLFQPAMRVITAITKAANASVTTSFAHNYKDGLIVRFDIPPKFGMFQINQLTGIVAVTSPTTFTVDINSTTFDAFSIPVQWPFSNQEALVVPVGEINATLKSATVNNSNPT